MAYGSFHNQIAGTNPALVPVVGMGATEICWSDRHAYTIVEVISPKHVVVQSDNVERTDTNGMSECQDYAFSPNPEGAKVHVTQRKNGQWVVQGESINGTKFTLGSRREYHDYSF